MKFNKHFTKSYTYRLFVLTQVAIVLPLITGEAVHARTAHGKLDWQIGIEIRYFLDSLDNGYGLVDLIKQFSDKLIGHDQATSHVIWAARLILNVLTCLVRAIHRCNWATILVYTLWHFVCFWKMSLCLLTNDWSVKEASWFFQF